jgi:hypothetical protein
MSVIAVESGLAQATMSPTTLPSMVVVDTTDTDGALGSGSLGSAVAASSVEEGSASSSTDEVSSSVALCEAVASEDEESSELEHATRDPAEANAAAVKRASLREYMCASCT